MKLYGNQGDVKAFAGSLYGMNPKTIVTYPTKSEEDIEFGIGLTVGSDGKVGKGNAKFAGVSVFHQCEGGKYFAGDAVAVLKSGHIWVKITDTGNENLAPGATAYVTNEGLFTANSSSSLEVGVFESVAEDGLALVYLK